MAGGFYWRKSERSRGKYILSYVENSSLKSLPNLPLRKGGEILPPLKKGD
jgi:hypothetical protein